MKTILLPQAIHSLAGVLESSIKTRCFYVDIHTGLNPDSKYSSWTILCSTYVSKDVDLSQYCDDEGKVDNDLIPMNVCNFIDIAYVYETGEYEILHIFNGTEKKVLRVDLEGLLNYFCSSLY